MGRSTYSHSATVRSVIRRTVAKLVRDLSARHGVDTYVALVVVVGLRKTKSNNEMKEAIMATYNLFV